MDEDDRRRRDDDEDSGLNLDQIRDALGQGEADPSETLPPTEPESGQHRELPELPREAPADRLLETFADGNSSSPAQESPLEGTEGFVREQRRGGVVFEDESDEMVVGTLADIARKSPPRNLPEGPKASARKFGPEGPPTRGPPTRGPPTKGPLITRPVAAGASPTATLVLAALAGLLVFATLFIRSLMVYRGVEYMGHNSDEISGTIMGMFPDTIILAQVASLGLHLVFGVTAGIIAGLLLLLTVDLTGLRLRRTLSFLASLGIVFLAHALVLGHAMALQPSVFSDTWYARGGLSRVVQILFSDYWPTWVTPGLGVVLLVYLGVGGAFALVRRGVGPSRLLGGLPILGAAGVFTLALWPMQPSIPPAENDRLNVVILAGDSLRHDSLDRGTEGGLSRLTADGIVFEDAWTAMARTLPAWVSFVTGQRPYSHGIRHMFPTSAEMAQVRRTVVHAFRDEGYQTGVFSDFAGDIFSRMDLGFETVRAPSFALDATVRLGSWKPHLHLVAWLRTFGIEDWIPNVQTWESMPLADKVTDEALDWLASRDPAAPFLMTVFWSTPHFPFASPHPFHQRHVTDGYDGPSRYLKTDMESTADDAEIERVDDLYGGTVDALDREVARILDALDAANLLDRTVVILLSDHGENLYEYDFGITHGDHLYGEASHRIPFVVRLPGGVGGLGGRTARGIDLAPSLRVLAGLDPATDADGVALFDGPMVPGQAAAPAVVPEKEPQAVYSETGLVFSRFDSGRLAGLHLQFENALHILDVNPNGWNIFLPPEYRRDFLLAKHRMWLRWPHKLLYIPTRQGPRWELFDLVKDPGETENLFSEDDPLSKRLRDELVTTLESAGDIRLENGYLMPR